MNNYLTYTAAAKLLKVLNSREVKIMTVDIDGHSVCFNPVEKESDEFNIQISNFPKVFTNLKSMYYLKKYSIDFDYHTESFKVSI